MDQFAAHGFWFLLGVIIGFVLAAIASTKEEKDDDQ